jgi:hypothetical protein
MGIQEEEVQAKGIGNIFNKIVVEISPNLKKEMPIQYWKLPEYQTDLTNIEPLHSIL